MRLRCPECKKLNWYFDSPTEPVNICLERGKMILRSQVDGRKLKRSSELKVKLRMEIIDETWGWTCENCGESIWADSDTKLWNALRNRVLKFLK